MLTEANNDLKQVLKAYRHQVKARQATRFGAERPSPRVASDAGDRAEQTPVSEYGSLHRSGRWVAPATEHPIDEVQRRISPLLDLNTPASPVSQARDYMLNAFLSEPGRGAGATPPRPSLKEPATSQRPLQASPRSEVTGAAQHQEPPLQPLLFQRDGARPHRDRPEFRAGQAEASGMWGCERSLSPQGAATQSHVASAPRAANVGCSQTAGLLRPTLPLPRYTMEQDRVQRQLQQVRTAIDRCDEELRELAQESESENRAAKACVSCQEFNPQQIEQELSECKKRVARLEQLNKLHTGSWAAEEAPSDASTSASLGVDDTWQQRAEALRDELVRQSALTSELQDRIHWLRAQLRRQPGLHDERVQEIVRLLVELAETLPKDERVGAISELLADITTQTEYAEAF